MSDSISPSDGPLRDLDDWDDDVRRRYSESNDEGISKDAFRDYSEETRDGVREFYRLNHENQTLDFGKQKRAEYLPLRRRRMGILDAMKYLDELIDDSDPDNDLPQIFHAMQTAEGIRAQDHPRWFVLTGLIHDLGKVLCLFGEPQWAVVGDTFPVGCRFSEEIVLPELFSDNPDMHLPEYQTKLGIYREHCGLEDVLMSWGHDEYLYHVVKDYLPEAAQYMIRYHSFYAGHRERAYDFLMNDHDREMFAWVRKFNPFDLYTKSPVQPDVSELMPYYEELVGEYFPAEIDW